MPLFGLVEPQPFAGLGMRDRSDTLVFEVQVAFRAPRKRHALVAAQCFYFLGRLGLECLLPGSAEALAGVQVLDVQHATLGKAIDEPRRQAPRDPAPARDDRLATLAGDPRAEQEQTSRPPSAVRQLVVKRDLLLPGILGRRVHIAPDADARRVSTGVRHEA